ncbi:hypothetical protein Tco_1411248 [Tanacetum coccineum]
MTTGFLSKLITKNCHLLTTKTVDDAPGLKAFKVPNQNLLGQWMMKLHLGFLPSKFLASTFNIYYEQILIRNFEGLEARWIIHYPGCEQKAILGNELG